MSTDLLKLSAETFEAQAVAKVHLLETAPGLLTSDIIHIVDHTVSAIANMFTINN